MTKTEMRPYQKETYDAALSTIASTNELYYALFLEQGLGKTKVAIDVINELYRRGFVDRVLCFADAGLPEQWVLDELPKHSQERYQAMVWQSTKSYIRKVEKFQKEHSRYPGLLWLCANIESLSRDTYLETFLKFTTGGRCALIVDEATSIKNPGAARTKNIIQTFHLDGKHVCPVRMILTGTPFATGVQNLWSMCEVLKSGYFGLNYTAFKKTYAMEKKTTTSRVPYPISSCWNATDLAIVQDKLEKGMGVADVAYCQWNVQYDFDDVYYVKTHPGMLYPIKNYDTLMSALCSHASFYKKADCLQLPPKVYQKVYLPFNAQQLTAYKAVLKDAYAKYGNAELTTANESALQIRLLQISGGFFPYTFVEEDGERYQLEKTEYKAIGKVPKIQYLVDTLKENLIPCIIACSFRAEVFELEKELSAAGIPCVAVLGGLDKDDKQARIEKFKSGEAKVLIAVTKVIAKGFNFQHVHLVYLYSQRKEIETRLQLEDRINRIGQEEMCLYVSLITKGSVDMAIESSVKFEVEALATLGSHAATKAFRVSDYEKLLKQEIETVD